MPQALTRLIPAAPSFATSSLVALRPAAASFVAASLAALLLATPAPAQVQFPTTPAPAPAAPQRLPSHCQAVASALGAQLQRVAWTEPLPANTLRLSYIRHATFALQTPGGLLAATDYTGTLGPADPVPDVVTMNHAHASHWTPAPDRRIAHVLRGWREDGGPAAHQLELGEMLVRSVSTDIRGYGGGIEANGNGIFIFEAAGLCVGHLGHLHQEPSPAQYAAIGRLDVVMAPVDGSMTMSQAAMIRVLQRLRSSVVIPMHWFSEATLQRFMAGMEGPFRVERPGVSEVTLSLATLPRQPTVMVLEPAWLD